MAKKSAKSHEITLRSSAAEYLTFVSAIGDQPESVELRYQDENIWLTQRLMAELYGVDVRTISEHIQKIYADYSALPRERLGECPRFELSGNSGWLPPLLIRGLHKSFVCVR